MPSDELARSRLPSDEARPDRGGRHTDAVLPVRHPALSPASQLALTLRAVGGLTTAEIARAFLVPEATIAQRISRAKQRIKASHIPFSLPPESERAERLHVVLHVLYLIFNEGYTASSGPDLQRGELTSEAIRLTREVRRVLPNDGEVAGLLALMLLTDARRAARTRARRQPRATGGAGPGAVEREATSTRASPWSPMHWRERRSVRTSSKRPSPRSTTRRRAPRTPTGSRSSPSTSCSSASRPIRWSPSITPWRWRWCEGPRAGLELLGTLDEDRRLAEHHRLDAVRAHLLEMAGDRAAAHSSYRRAARRTTSLPERRYLDARANRLTSYRP